MSARITAIIGIKGAGKFRLYSEIIKDKKPWTITRDALPNPSLPDGVEVVVFPDADESDFEALNYLWNSRTLPHLVITSDTLTREDLHPDVQVIELIRTA